LHSFSVLDGASPLGGVIEGTDGNLYGTTSAGGDTNCDPSNGCGTVFKITLQGDFTTLHVFEGGDGDEPPAGLVQAADGNFYGLTLFGGKPDCQMGLDPPGCGTVFRITRTGGFTTIHKFDGSDGALPFGGLMQATDKNLYGATDFGGTDSVGTIFSIGPDGNLTTLHDFDGGDGDVPVGSLVQSTNGILYGATEGGGQFSCAFGPQCGTVFSLDMGLGPFVTFALATGKVGQTGPILGQGFTGTTSVSLNGTPATFTVKSDTFIEATVPAGATTGYVTVNTPSGTLTSNVPFHVIQ
jgi:uncharacterized repeat protein (TIGR03803 family)